jgi:crotonobetainyl-CoA:carnitine CoA-transferase CaiB-like acyl-CoA transferase
MDGYDVAMGPVPELGQHTQSVLAELEFDRETIDRWKQAGMI